MELFLTVEDHFLIRGRGIVVLPWLDNPENWRFKPFSGKVVIRRPDRTEEQCIVSFTLEHVHFSHEGSNTYIVLQFPEQTKETVPIGSQVFASEELLQKLGGEMPKKLDSTKS
ncbi:MAG TPA: hypothetical protein VF893_05285 [Candidatus Bathyarchaeia archaeon]